MADISRSCFKAMPGPASERGDFMDFKNIATAALASALAAFGVTAAAAAPGDFNITLKPMRTAAGKVDRVEVRQRIEGVAPADGQPLTLAANVAIFGTPAVADRITGLEAADADGSIPLKAQDDPVAPGGAGYARRWKAQRPVKFPVTVSYTAAVQPDGVGSGPAYGLRPSGGGVAAMGSGFLLLPTNAGTTATHLRWDLSGLPPGSVGVINAGEGDMTLKGPASELARQWILAGPAGVYHAPGGTPFTGYWLGKPPFDPEAEMAWAAKAYAGLAKHFRYLDPAPSYRVFIKMLDSPPRGGGSAGPGAFLMSLMEGVPREVRGTFFHEMSHQWVGGLKGENGPWFSEGLNTHYSTVLPIKLGLVSAADFGKELNGVARGYYEGKGAKLSLAEIANIGFGDEQIRQTPYRRGALYFAELDARLRAKSGGKRDLDAVVLPMMAARAKGTPITVASWEAMLQKELGPAAVADFRAEVVDGTKRIEPASDAYGPCFRRVESPMTSGVDQSKIAGYQWERIAGVPDAACGKF